MLPSSIVFTCLGPQRKTKPSNDPEVTEVTFSYHTNACLKRTTIREALEMCSRSSTFRVTVSINLCASNSLRVSEGPKGVTSSLEPMATLTLSTADLNAPQTSGASRRRFA